MAYQKNIIFLTNKLLDLSFSPFTLIPSETESSISSLGPELQWLILKEVLLTLSSRICMCFNMDVIKI